MSANEAPSLRLRGHPPRAPFATQGRFLSGFVYRHRASKFERLIKVVSHARCAVAAVAVVDAIFAGQAPKGDAESPKFGRDKLKS
jgi:hypothetical protein